MYHWVNTITGQTVSKSLQTCERSVPSPWSRFLYSSSQRSSDKVVCRNGPLLPCPATPGTERRHSPPSLTSPGFVGPTVVLAKNLHTNKGNTVYSILYQPEEITRDNDQTWQRRRKHSRKYCYINKDKNNPFKNTELMSL